MTDAEYRKLLIEKLSNINDKLLMIDMYLEDEISDCFVDLIAFYEKKIIKNSYSIIDKFQISRKDVRIKELEEYWVVAMKIHYELKEGVKHV